MVKCYISDNSMIMDSSFILLRSLTFGIGNFKEIIRLSNLSCLPCLQSLTVYLHNSLGWSDIYKEIFTIPTLKYAKLSFEAVSNFGSFLSIATEHEYNLIESLNVDHNCTVGQLFTILSYIPQLQRLTCKKLSESQHFNVKQLINKPTLTHISIGECSLNFVDFEIFLKEITSQLKVLRISTLNDVTYLNANRWERLISQYMPDLSIFEFKYTEYIDKNFQLTAHHRVIDRFTSSFWIGRRWLLEYKVGAGGRKGGLISYIIRPYRYNEKDPLMNKFANQHESNDSSLTFSSFVQLTIIHLAFLKWTRSFIGCIKPVLSLFKVTRLVFGKHGISIRTLIELIRMLPHLDSLAISSFAFLDKKSLSLPTSKSSGSKKNENKITKVHIGMVTLLEEIQFLIDLCPHMNYLEMDRIDNIDPEALLRLILNQYRKNISLYFRCFQLNDPITQKFDNNYLLTRAFNSIYFQHKK